VQADDPLPSEWRRTHVRLQTLLDEAMADDDLSADGARSVLQEMGTALEELRVAEEELSTQAEQLAASAIAIDQERERYAELFEFAPDAYLEVDHEFHMEICRAADNRILDRIMYSARWLGTASRRITNEAPAALRKATTDHTAIYEALFASWLPPLNASLAFALSFVLVFYLGLRALHRRNIIFKV